MDLVAASGRRYPILGLVKIGRDPECQIRPPDVLVSRVHALVWEQDGQVRVRDEGSSNGTYVNGTRLPPRHTRPLALGDQVQIGTTLLTVAAGTGPRGGPGADDYDTLVEPVEPGPPRATAPLPAEGPARPTAAHPSPSTSAVPPAVPVGAKIAAGIAIGCAVLLLLSLCGVVAYAVLGAVITGTW
jgi:predicted component of type VI protein secretion system